MDLPIDNSDYSKPDYWDKRFRDETEFNWLGGLEHYKDALQSMLKDYSKGDSILHIGCGNSSFSTELRSQGWSNITNIDISINGLNKLKEREKSSEYILMDMTCMPLRDNSYDIILEKATLDSLQVTTKSPWDLQSKENRLVSKVLSEISRILRPGGTFISITFSQPHFRVPLLCERSLGWSVHVDTVQGAGLPTYVMQMCEGDPGEALESYCWVRTNHTTYSSPDDSSDDESFVANINTFSDSESDHPSESEASR